MSAFDWFAKWNVYNPEKIAVEEFETGRAFSFGELHRLGCFLAHDLIHKKGLKQGDRIAILAENCLEYIALFAAAQKTGLILVPLNYRLTAREIDFLLSDSQPRLIIYDEKFKEKLEPSSHFKNAGFTLPMTRLEAFCRKFLSSGEEVEFNNIPFNENHPLFIIYTSGTTAFPKGSVYTHKMLLWNAINTEIRLDVTSDDRSINCAPPFHTGSWNVLMTPFFLHGATTIMMKGFDADAILQIIEKEKISIFWGVPTMLKMMAESPVFDKANLSSMRYIIVGGEAMPIPLIELLHNRNIPIRQGYGLTEVGPNVTSLNHTDAIRKQGSIGTPNFFYQVKLVNEEGKELAGAATGELLLKGPNVTPGYWNNPEATEETIKDGWFHTGDRVRRDEDGFLFVVDRIKNMYISGGENVYPAEVEYLLRQHPSIDHVAIVGVPDPKWGETGMAFVVLKKDGMLTKTEMLEYCRKNLAKYKIPGHIAFVEELPKNDAGKIDRKALKNFNPANQ
ncbi:MAG: class I adenylate-forming enzyme family protein [Bacteroidota bacterium]